MLKKYTYENLSHMLTPCELWLDACTELRRNGAALSLAPRAMESGNLLHSALTRPSSANAWRLKSKHPFVPAAQQLISASDNNIRAAQWADNPTRLRFFIPDTGT